MNDGSMPYLNPACGAKSAIDLSTNKNAEKKPQKKTKRERDTLRERQINRPRS